MSAEGSAGDREPWSGEAGARRLFALVRDACAEADDFPARLAAGLRAALGMLAAEPELAYLLTVQPYLGGEELALDAQRDWIGRFGDLLNGAATGDARASREPSFLAPFLIGGVRFQIARLVLNGDSSDLPGLLPGTLEALLAYYFEPDDRPGLARAAIGAQDESIAADRRGQPPGSSGPPP
jgi:hypothetical protein